MMEMIFLTQTINARNKDGSRVFTNSEVLNTSINLVHGAYETSALALTWALHLISHNPRVQAKINEELKLLNGETPNFQQLNDLQYITAVIFETFRMYTLITINRELLEDVDMGDGLVIPKGTVVQASSYGIGANPNVYDNPDEFRPERFLDYDPFSDEQKHLLLPFGMGPRMCPGRKVALSVLKLLLAMICQRFELVPEIGTTQKN